MGGKGNNRGWQKEFGPWYVGKLTKSDGSFEFLEAVNGGPFRTINGAETSLKRYIRRGRTLEIVELQVKGVIRKVMT